MTTQNAVDMVKITLDEVGVEYYDSIIILQALEQAQFEVMEYAWGAGFKDVIAPNEFRVALNGNGVAGIPIAAAIAPNNLQYPFAVFVKMRAVEPEPTWSARWVEPEQWLRRQYDNPSTADVVSGRLQYSVINEVLYHNGAAGDCTLYYISAPYLPDITTPLSLNVIGQTWVVDRAAQILQAKAVDEPAHESAGVGANITELMKNKEQQ